MAVKRPQFTSQKKPTSSSANKRPASSGVKRRKRVPAKKKGLVLRYFLYALLVGLIFVDSGWPPGRGIVESVAQVDPFDRETDSDWQVETNFNNNDNEEVRPTEIQPINFTEGRTTILGEVGLSGEQMRKVAIHILAVAKAMTAQYEVADGLTLSMYVLRYLAEIGEYELAYKDIMILVTAFERQTGNPVSQQVKDILEQVKKIRFGKRDGKYFSQFFSKNPQRGIIIPIDQRSEDPDSSLKEIKRVVAIEGSFLYFSEVDTAAEKKKVRDFIKTPVKILNVLEAIVDALNQIHPDILQGIDDYLERTDTPAPPMMIAMGGISVEVGTRTLFNDITFDFKEAYTFPGLRLEGEPLPTFVLGAKAKLLNLKVSVDQ